jgi:site-specific recombinase XerD
MGNMTFGSPVPHSLRHSFAINTLNRIKARGISPRQALPVLAAYMGHRKYQYTAAYLKVKDAERSCRPDRLHQIPIGCGMRLSAVIHQFFDTYLPHIKGVSPNSIKAYRDTFKLFLPFAATAMASRSVRYHSSSYPGGHPLFLDYLESERKNSARTRNHRLAAIKSLAKMIRFMPPAVVGVDG